MIDILMAVYNGEKYLAEQIESILAQTETDWRLFICDDCSADSSYDIACGYAEKFPEKITALRSDAPSGSAKANFMKMLSLAESEYIMFSDQDDYWLPHKIRLTAERMTETEKAYPDAPIAVHTQLEIADEALNTLHGSFTHYQGLDPSYKSLNRLLTQNNVTGCTLMINRRLLEFIKDIPPDDMLMHDWWIALAASAFGRIEFVDTPTIRYRQHGENQLGAVNNRSLKGAAKIVLERSNTKKRVSITFEQAEKFYKAYCSSLPEDAKKCLETYLSIPKHGKIVRAAMLLKHGYLKQNFLTAAGQLIFC